MTHEKVAMNGQFEVRCDGIECADINAMWTSLGGDENVDTIRLRESK